MVENLLINKAAKLAGKYRSSKKKYLFAALAIRADGAIVSSKNHDSPFRHFSHHAEARVLRKANNGSILFVARVLKKDPSLWANAKPCPRCQKLIQQRGVKTVYYTLEGNQIGVWYP